MDKLSVSDYLKPYLSKNTRKAYRNGIRKFFKIINPTLKNEDIDNYSLEYVSGEPNIRDDLVKFRDAIEQSPPKTLNLYLTCVAGYLTENGISVPSKLLSTLKGRGNEAISAEYIPTNEEIEHIINHLPLIGKCITLCLTSSGMRLNELLSLQLTDIELSRNPVRINLRAKTTKSQKKRIAFISTEAKKLVEEWLSYRDEWIETTKARSTFSFNDNNRLYPITTIAFERMWTRAVEKAKLSKKDITTGRLECRIHNLRKFFRTRGGWTNPDVSEALMGHQEGLSTIYARFDQAEEMLEQGYLQAEPNLSIYEHSKSNIELQQTVKKQSVEISEALSTLVLRNSKLEEKVDEQEKLHDELMGVVVSMNNQIKEMQKELDRLGGKTIIGK